MLLIGPKAATTSITRLPNLVKGINNLVKGIDNLVNEVLNLVNEVLNLMNEVLNLVKGIDNLVNEVLNLVNEVAQLVKIAKNRVELAPDTPSLTSTDKSVCATPALPVASFMSVKQDCVAQTTRVQISQRRDPWIRAGLPRSGAKATGGGSYGSRWSRAKHETTGSTNAPRFSDRGSGRGGNSRRLVFDPRPLPGVEENIRPHFPVVSRFASDHRLPYVSPPATAFR